MRAGAASPPGGATLGATSGKFRAPYIKVRPHGEGGLGYIQEKLFKAVDGLASSEADLSRRLDYAADFIMRIEEGHFPQSDDGPRQLEKFRSIRERLFDGGRAPAWLALKKLSSENMRELSHDIVGLAFDVIGFIEPAIDPRPSGPPSLKIVK